MGTLYDTSLRKQNLITMSIINYYRTFSHPEVCDELISEAFGVSYVPKGYKLVEEDSHKKERLEKEQEGLLNRIETLQKYLVEAEEKRKIVEEDLKKLK